MIPGFVETLRDKRSHRAWRSRPEWQV